MIATRASAMAQGAALHFAQPTEATIEGHYAAMRRFWHPVMPSDALTDMPHAAELLAEQIVLARLNGEVVAMQDLCRHFQAKLSLGEIHHVRGKGDCLMCPYHGWSYAEDGQCVEIPQLTPDRQIPADAIVPTYLTSERYGLIWVCLDPQPIYPIPELPLVDDASFLVGPLRTYAPWAASAPRVIMAALDDTHGPWVHEGLVGDRSNPLPPDHRVARDGRNMVVQVKMMQPVNPTIAEEGLSGMQEVHLTTTVGIPNTIHFTIRAKGSARVTLIWQAVCPVRYDQTLTFWGSARNYDHDQPVYNPEFEAMQDILREQDRRIVESQRPWLLPPFWTKLELPLRPADLPLIEYQRWLEDLGITLAL